MEVEREHIQDQNRIQNRIELNTHYGKGDFDSWIDSIIQRLTFRLALDLCCGTGKQLVQLVKRNPEAEIIGVDIASDALEKAYHKLLQNPPRAFSLCCYDMDQLHQNSYFQRITFDLIICCYGLYYANDLENVLRYMVEHLTSEGTILIVGPYGKNNATFYALLSEYYPIPDLVLRASTTFMEKEVEPFLAQYCTVQKETFVNPVYFPDVDSVLTYWKSTIYYNSEVEHLIRARLEDHFRKNDHFLIEKHVMALIATKK
jgi:ubiquinone/menaquinone biosynthesis C-methylase UbiE